MIFLSHSWNEKPIARRIVEALARRGLPAWLDEQQLPAGNLLRPGLLEAVGASQVYLYLISEKANASSWVQDELRFAVACQRDRGLRVIPVRLVGDDTPLPTLLIGSLYHSLDPEGGGIPSLAHELASVPSADTVPDGTRVAGTVRLGARRVEHTLSETAPLLAQGATRHLLVLDQAYERLDSRYWSLADQGLPAKLRGRPQDLAAADAVLDSIHSQCRRAIDAVPALGRLHAEHFDAPRGRYYVAAIERIMYVMLHRLTFNCRYLAALKAEGEFTQTDMEARDLAPPYDGHTCEFVVDDRSLGKVEVPAHGHPLPERMPLQPWGLTSPFSDMLDLEVGAAVGEIIGRRLLAGTLASPDIPVPEDLRYGLG